MTMQVLFKMDRRLKEKVALKARGEGLSMSAVLNMAARAYVESRVIVNLFNPESLSEDWQDMGGNDSIKHLGKISKKERDYYENL